MRVKNAFLTEIKGSVINVSRTHGHRLLCCRGCTDRGNRQCNCCSIVKTISYVLLFYTFSISLTFFNQRFIRHFRFPLSITLIHLLTKFLLAAVVRSILYCRTGKHRVTLGWKEYFKSVAPAGVTGSLDIGLSNWSFAFITISLNIHELQTGGASKVPNEGIFQHYTMTKTTAIVFIFAFSVIFRLEKPRCSLIVVILFIAVGLFMFTYESTQFNLIGFLLVLSASFISGMRWTLAQIVLQRSELGLSNPVDMMYHIQPWMILSLLPLSTTFEGVNLATSENGFAFQDGYILLRNFSILLSGALLAFMLEISEFLVVSHASSLTLSIAGICKEVIMVLMAAFINGDEISPINAIGLVTCLAGITLHVVLKATDNESNSKHSKTASTQEPLLNSNGSDEVDSSEQQTSSSFSNNRKR